MLQVTRFGFVNTYLVADDDGLTLIDAALPGSAKPILAAAERLGAPIVRITLTHAHQDHIGALDALAKALPEAEVVIGTREARLLRKDKTLDPGEPGKVRGSYPGAKTEPTRTVAEGDVVGSLQVIAAPGHTPGQVAFLDPRDGTLYCGDAFVNLGGLATPARPSRWFPLPGWATWDRPTALRTAQALRALAPERLAAGHGRVLEAPGAAMDAAIARAA